MLQYSIVIVIVLGRKRAEKRHRKKSEHGVKQRKMKLELKGRKNRGINRINSIEEKQREPSKSKSKKT